MQDLTERTLSAERKYTGRIISVDLLDIEMPDGRQAKREVVKRLAAEQGLPKDAAMGRILELGGLDFLVKGAESMGKDRCDRPSAVAAAARALALYLDPDNAAMFGGVGNGKREG